MSTPFLDGAPTHLGSDLESATVFGLLYGVVAYVIMTRVVVPLSLAEFGREPPPLLNLMVSLFMQLVLFGLPIALVASRIRTLDA